MDLLLTPVASAWQRTLALRIITDQGFKGAQPLPVGDTAQLDTQR